MLTLTADGSANQERTGDVVELLEKLSQIFCPWLTKAPILNASQHPQVLTLTL